MKATRIKDVARIAGVSTATVSRALSNPSIVSASTREAVERAIAQTGYTVNLTARNLRRKRVGGVLALVPNLANPFFSRILAGISGVLRTEGLNLLVADTTTAPEARGGLVDYADRSRTDGLIVLDGALPAAVLSRPGCPPVVQACEWIAGLDAPRILADNAGGARIAVEHLVSLGHSRIGRLCGPEGNTLTQARGAGFGAALAEAALELRSDWILAGDFSFRAGREAAAAILRMPERPSAIFCDSDEMACGLIGGLQQAGLRVPADLSVLGFDDVQLSAHFAPSLTTVRQHQVLIGERAARVMLDLLAGGSPDLETIVPVELVLRESTAPPE